MLQKSTLLCTLFAACVAAAPLHDERADATPNTAAIDLTFADESFQKVFAEDFSWEQRHNEARYFDVGNHGGREALRIRIYEGDKTTWEGNPSCPATELRPRTRDTLKADTEYTAEWDWQLQHYTAPYTFAFAQIYGGAPRNEPNIFLRYGSHGKQQYNIVCEECNLSGRDINIPNAAADIGKWVKWRVEFRLSASSRGHLRVFHNGLEVYKYSGKTSDGSGGNWKTGIHTQRVKGVHQCITTNTVGYLSNLTIKPTTSLGAINIASVLEQTMQHADWAKHDVTILVDWLLATLKMIVGQAL